VTLKAAGSSFTLTTKTNTEGEFDVQQAPIGVYTLKIAAPGFASTEQVITIASGTNPVVHIQLTVASATQTVVIQAQQTSIPASGSVTPTTLITREDIDQTPGATRTIGMEMITDYVPGAYMTHDMLHMRGGHQTSWLIDGVAIPNTKIASNVGPQIDPKDIDSMETQRGSYDAELGDRTYGMFNVLPRNGFEFNRNGEVMLYAGDLDTGEAQIALGDHSEKSAWYSSATGSRSNYGLETPVAAIYHDATNSESGFVSLIRNQTAKDQIRVDGQYRQDFFQVPYDPNPNDFECASEYYCSSGLRDAQSERDSFAIANWVHTISPKALVSVAPFYHFNQANYDSLATDQPVATTWHQESNYAGAQADARLDAGPDAFLNSFSGGMYSFYQKENDLFGVLVNDGSGTSQPNKSANEDAGLVEFSLGDHLRLGRGEERNGGRRKTVLLANSFEAVLAALYLDAGLDTARSFIQRTVIEPTATRLYKGLERGESMGDHKSALQEMLQARGATPPEYEVKAETGPDHRKRFLVEVVIPASPQLPPVKAQGTGTTKKRAEQEAARAAFLQLQEQAASPNASKGATA